MLRARGGRKSGVESHVAISRAMRASVQTKAGDRASVVIWHSSTATCDSAQVPIAHTFDTLGEYFEFNPTRFFDLRRIALRRRGRLLCG
jgi:hypothetical protein